MILLDYVIPGSEVFKVTDISSAEVKDEISKAKDGKSAGLDKISQKLLKSAGDTIIDSLTFIFNLSLNTGIFPDDLKYAKVTPIYKSEDRKDCSDYRPISVISTVAKIFEKLVYKTTDFVFR